MARKRRIICMNVVPGEPTNGSGRVCIHLFVPDDRGLVVEPHALHPVYKGGGQKVTSKPTRGRLACDLKKRVRPVTRDGITTIVSRTDSPHAVTCPACMKTEIYKAMVESTEPTKRGN